MEFSRQEHWNGLPFPSPRDVPDPGIRAGPAALQADSLPAVTKEAHSQVMEVPETDILP